MLEVIATRANSVHTGLPAYIHDDLPDDNVLIDYARHHATNPPALPAANNAWWPVTTAEHLTIGTQIPTTLDAFTTDPNYQWEPITAIHPAPDSPEITTITTRTSTTTYSPDTAIPTRPVNSLERVIALQRNTDGPDPMTH